MNEKKKDILEAGMRLFSEKGFHNTTIQEIAKQSGVSKGAFYLHFDSKEDLTLNIFNYYYERLMDQVKSVRKENLEPKDALAKQIQVLLESFVENKEFIVMHMRDNVSLGEKVNTFIQHLKKENFQWNSENLLSIYGEQLAPYIVDASTLSDGIVNGYLRWLIIDNINIDIQQLSQFITRRIDNCITGLLEEKETAQITLEELAKHIPGIIRKEESPSIRLSLESMKDKIDQVVVDEKKRNDLLVALDVLLQEEAKETPQPVIFQGMLTHFTAIPEFKDNCEAIAERLNIKLFQ